MWVVELHNRFVLVDFPGRGITIPAFTHYVITVLIVELSGSIKKSKVSFGFQIQISLCPSRFALGNFVYSGLYRRCKSILQKTHAKLSSAAQGVFDVCRWCKKHSGIAPPGENITKRCVQLFAQIFVDFFHRRFTAGFIRCVKELLCQIRINNKPFSEQFLRGLLVVTASGKCAHVGKLGKPPHNGFRRLFAPVLKHAFQCRFRPCCYMFVELLQDKVCHFPGILFGKLMVFHQHIRYLLCNGGLVCLAAPDDFRGFRANIADCFVDVLCDAATDLVKVDFAVQEIVQCRQHGFIIFVFFLEFGLCLVPCLCVFFRIIQEVFNGFRMVVFSSGLVLGDVVIGKCFQVCFDGFCHRTRAASVCVFAAGNHIRQLFADFLQPIFHGNTVVSPGIKCFMDVFKQPQGCFPHIVHGLHDLGLFLCGNCCAMTAAVLFGFCSQTGSNSASTLQLSFGRQLPENR